MRKWIWALLAALPLTLGGLLYASSQARPASEEGFVCPLTGEELPCSNCCPLNN